jgi:hypothetical protein
MKFKKKLTISLLSLSLSVSAQHSEKTFHSTRILNGHSNETLKKRNFEYRIEHRFGDFAGTNGGGQNGFGFDNASDIRFALELGLTDKLMIGLGRSKGSSNAYRNVLDGFVKYKLIEQKEDGAPISISALGLSTYTYVKKSADKYSISYFPEANHRLAYTSQLILTRKFGKRISAALIPSYVHRNYVRSDDFNGIFAVGSALNYKMTKSLGLIVEYYHAFRNANPGNIYKDALAFGFEWATFGHNFHVTLSNSSLFNETQFITSTTEDWAKGQFRLGFSISRNFIF